MELGPLAEALQRRRSAAGYDAQHALNKFCAPPLPPDNPVRKPLGECNNVPKRSAMPPATSSSQAPRHGVTGLEYRQGTNSRPSDPGSKGAPADVDVGKRVSAAGSEARSSTAGLPPGSGLPQRPSTTAFEQRLSNGGFEQRPSAGGHEQQRPSAAASELRKSAAGFEQRLSAAGFEKRSNPPIPQQRPSAAGEAGAEERPSIASFATHPALTGASDPRPCGSGPVDLVAGPQYRWSAAGQDPAQPSHQPQQRRPQQPTQPQVIPLHHPRQPPPLPQHPQQQQQPEQHVDAPLTAALRQASMSHLQRPSLGSAQPPQPNSARALPATSHAAPQHHHSQPQHQPLSRAAPPAQLQRPHRPAPPPPQPASLQRVSTTALPRPSAPTMPMTAAAAARAGSAAGAKVVAAAAATATAASISWTAICAEGRAEADRKRGLALPPDDRSELKQWLFHDIMQRQGAATHGQTTIAFPPTLPGGPNHPPMRPGSARYL